MDTSASPASHIPTATAEVLREYGPFDSVEGVAGVSFDGRNVWAALGKHVVAFDPASGDTVRTLDLPGDAGTAFDGTHLYQIAEARIDRIDLATGQVVHSIPSPSDGRDSGMAWADGRLWVGEYRERRIHEIDPDTGAVLRTLSSDRFVTGVTWVDDALWHGTWENDESELRRIDPADGAVLERLRLPEGVFVSGLENDGAGTFYCGGGSRNVVRAVRKPATPA